MFATAARTLFAEANTPGLQGLKQLSLDELTALEVTSVSRRSEKLGESAAAVQVLTGDRIIRSGATSLQDALRLATGVHVSQIDGREWAISARGFASVASEKMEVSMDGRSLYGPLFSGVLWDVQSAVLEDLDRIEVIRGAGAALWGANAVNGVISIVTKPASETQGAFVNTIVSATEREGVVRYGGALPTGGFYRAYAHGVSALGLRFQDGANVGDDRRMLKVGGRADMPVGPEGKLTLQSDVYRALIRQYQLPQSTVVGGNGIARFESRLPDGTKWRAQGSYEHSSRRIPQTYSEVRNTGEGFGEIEIVGAHSRSTVGVRSRISADRTGPTVALGFMPRNRTIASYGAYAQSRVELPDPRWSATLGSTLEHNSFTGWEVQPTARLAFVPGANWMAWVGVSHAVRTPSRIDRDVIVPGPGALTILTGDAGFRSEDVDSIETGWRFSRSEQWSIELNAFSNRFRHLRSIEPGTGNVLFVTRNLLDARSNGLELTATARPSRTVRVVLGARQLDKSLSLRPESRSPVPVTYQGNDARTVFTLQTSIDLPAAVQCDVVLRHAGDLPAPHVAAYTEADVRLAWWWRRRWEIALSGRNLLHAQHIEGVPGAGPAEAVRRSVAISVTWRQ